MLQIRRSLDHEYLRTILKEADNPPAQLSRIVIAQPMHSRHSTQNNIIAQSIHIHSRHQSQSSMISQPIHLFHSRQETETSILVEGRL
jgi:hypothetical protein